MILFFAKTIHHHTLLMGYYLRIEINSIYVYLMLEEKEKSYAYGAITKQHLLNCYFKNGQ